MMGYVMLFNLNIWTPPTLQATSLLLVHRSGLHKYIRPLVRPSTRAPMTIRSQEPRKFYGVGASVQTIRLILRRSYLLPSAFTL